MCKLNLENLCNFSNFTAILENSKTGSDYWIMNTQKLLPVSQFTQITVKFLEIPSIFIIYLAQWSLSKVCFTLEFNARGCRSRLELGHLWTHHPTYIVIYILLHKEIINTYKSHSRNAQYKLIKHQTHNNQDKQFPPKNVIIKRTQ